MYMATAASELFLQSRGVRLSDATVPNEAVHQRGKPSLISLVYLAQRPAQSTPKKLLFLSLAFSDSAWLPQSVVIWSCRSLVAVIRAVPKCVASGLRLSHASAELSIAKLQYTGGCSIDVDQCAHLEGSNLKMFKNNETSELPTPCAEPGRVGVLSTDRSTRDAGSRQCRTEGTPTWRDTPW